MSNPYRIGYDAGKALEMACRRCSPVHVYATLVCKPTYVYIYIYISFYLFTYHMYIYVCM